MFRIAVQIRADDGRLREANLVQRRLHGAEPRERNLGRLLGAALKNRPVAQRRGVGDAPVRRHPHARVIGGKVIQAPFVAGQETQGNGKICDGEWVGGFVGARKFPGQAALAQRHAAHFEFQVGERGVIQLHVGGARSEFRQHGAVGAEHANLVGDDAAIRAQAETGEFQIHAARPKIFQQGSLDEAGEPDLVQIRAEADQHKKRQQHRDAEAAEVDPQPPPRGALRFALGLRGHRGRGC